MKDFKAAIQQYKQQMQAKQTNVAVRDTRSNVSIRLAAVTTELGNLVTNVNEAQEALTVAFSDLTVEIHFTNTDENHGMLVPDKIVGKFSNNISVMVIVEELESKTVLNILVRPSSEDTLRMNLNGIAPR